MDIYTALQIANITLGCLIGVAVIMFVLWFVFERKVAKYGKSLLYKYGKKSK